MRLTKISMFVLLVGCFTGTCVNPPEFSAVPHIDLLGITFKRGDVTKGVQDTLIFRLKFADSDGDLGVTAIDPNAFDSANPWYYAYNPSNLSVLPLTDITGQIPTGYKPVNYQAKRTLPQFDTLPALVCGSWELLRNSLNQAIDTIYIRQNKKAFNVNVDVYAKTNSGTYVPLNYTTRNYNFSNCSYNLFRANLPNLSNDQSTALNGAITFRITSFDLHDFFNIQTLKMDVTVFDRAYHASNTVEKKDFTIAQISK